MSYRFRGNREIGVRDISDLSFVVFFSSRSILFIDKFKVTKIRNVNANVINANSKCACNYIHKFHTRDFFHECNEAAREREKDRKKRIQWNISTRREIKYYTTTGDRIFCALRKPLKCVSHKTRNMRKIYLFF